MEIEKEDLYHELEIMRKIPHHPNVVDYLGCCTQQGGCHIWHHIQLSIQAMISVEITIGSVDTFQWMLYFWIKDPFYIIMEYVAGGNMQQYLRKFRPSQQATNSEELVPPTAKDLKSFALQISRGMEHLSSLNVRTN